MEGLDGIVASIAGRQHGNVARRQLVAAGISEAWIDRRRDKGSLIGVFPGVYRVGHAAPSMEADCMAAVLACGDGAVLSGRAAARLLGLTRGVPPEPQVLAKTKRSIDGIETRRIRAMDSRERMTWKGIPVTTPARTLADLAESFSPDALARAMHQADVLHGTTPDDVDEVLQRSPTRKAPPRSAKSSGATRAASSASSSELSSSCSRRTACRSQPPTARRTDSLSTVVGPSTS
jgi:hypothetical protein